MASLCICCSLYGDAFPSILHMALSLAVRPLNDSGTMTLKNLSPHQECFHWSMGFLEKDKYGRTPFTWFSPLHGTTDLAALAKFMNEEPEWPLTPLSLREGIPSLCFIYLQNPYHRPQLQYTRTVHWFVVCLPCENVLSPRAGEVLLAPLPVLPASPGQEVSAPHRCVAMNEQTSISKGLWHFWSSDRVCRVSCLPGGAERSFASPLSPIMKPMDGILGTSIRSPPAQRGGTQPLFCEESSHCRAGQPQAWSPWGKGGPSALRRLPMAASSSEECLPSSWHQVEGLQGCWTGPEVLGESQRLFVSFFLWSI